MLVSSIARFNATNNMNKASFASMQVVNSMANSLNNLHTFGGEHDLSMLNQMDKRNSLDLLTNKLLYNVSYLQEKMNAKHQSNNIKKSLNILA